MLDLVCLTVRCSCRKFCDNCKSIELFPQCIADMLADCFDIAAKQQGQLLSVKPHRILVHLHIEVHGVVRALVLPVENRVARAATTSIVTTPAHRMPAMEATSEAMSAPAAGSSVPEA